MATDGTHSLYMDLPAWKEGPRADDFLVAVGKTKSNSVYHVASVKPVPQKDRRVTRHYMRVFHTELNTALQREDGQKLWTLSWYLRGKKKN